MTKLLPLLLILTACGAPITPQPKAGDTHELPPIEWRIVSDTELRKVYAEAGMPLDDKQVLKGFVGKQGGKVVIYTPPPRYVDDDVITSLGHEVAHVALGDYHNKPKEQ